MVNKRSNSPEDQVRKRRKVYKVSKGSRGSNVLVSNQPDSRCKGSSVPVRLARPDCPDRRLLKVAQASLASPLTVRRSR